MTRDQKRIQDKQVAREYFVAFMLLWMGVALLLECVI